MVDRRSNGRKQEDPVDFLRPSSLVVLSPPQQVEALLGILVSPVVESLPLSSQLCHISSLFLSWASNYFSMLLVR